jgi:hypothetical protein
MLHCYIPQRRTAEKKSAAAGSGFSIRRIDIKLFPRPSGPMAFARLT